MRHRRSSLWKQRSVVLPSRPAEPAIPFDERALRDLKELRYMVRHGTSWSSPITVDKVAGEQSSISVDASSEVHIAYRDTVHYTLLHASRAPGGAFELTTVDASANVGSNLSSTVDDTGKPHIVYTDLTSGDLKYATRGCD